MKGSDVLRGHASGLLHCLSLKRRYARRVSEELFSAADTMDFLVSTLERILYAHDTGNNGAAMGEAVLCNHFANMARDALARAKGERSSSDEQREEGEP